MVSCQSWRFKYLVMLFGLCSILVTSVHFINDINFPGVLFRWLFNLSVDFLEPSNVGWWCFVPNSDLQVKWFVDLSISSLCMIWFKLTSLLWSGYSFPRQVRTGPRNIYWYYFCIFINLDYPEKWLSILLKNQILEELYAGQSGF